MKTLLLAVFCALLAVSLAKPFLQLEEDETYAPEKFYPTDEPERIFRTSHRRGDATAKIAALSFKARSRPLVFSGDAERVIPALARHSKSAPAVLHRTLHRRSDAYSVIPALARTK